MSLIKDFPVEPNNQTDSAVVHTSDNCEKPSYHNVRFTVLELFKFTIGMGDLQFIDHVHYKEVFYILLILYIILTYILLLNMLIALMGSTVERISKETENIWNLQRSHTILDMEMTLPKWILKNLSGQSKTIRFKHQKDKSHKFLRVEETDWTQWRSHLRVYQEEDPGTDILSVQSTKTHKRNWNLPPLRNRVRRSQPPPSSKQIITTSKV